MEYSLCMEANRTTRLSTQPPTRLSEYKKTWESEERITTEKKELEELWKLTFDIAEIEHNF